jgi:hypothetical protein
MRITAAAAKARNRNLMLNRRSFRSIEFRSIKQIHRTKTSRPEANADATSADVWPPQPGRARRANTHYCVFGMRRHSQQRVQWPLGCKFPQKWGESLSAWGREGPLTAPQGSEAAKSRRPPSRSVRPLRVLAVSAGACAPSRKPRAGRTLACGPRKMRWCQIRVQIPSDARLLLRRWQRLRVVGQRIEISDDVGALGLL